VDVLLQDDLLVFWEGDEEPLCGKEPTEPK
jgi:hypothetical protein